MPPPVIGEAENPAVDVATTTSLSLCKNYQLPLEREDAKSVCARVNNGRCQQ